jgi:hypothetical protein
MKPGFSECKPNHQLQRFSGKALAGMGGADEIADASALQSPADDVEKIYIADNGAVFLSTNQKAKKIVAAASVEVISKLLLTFEGRN